MKNKLFCVIGIIVILVTVGCGPTKNSTGDKKPQKTDEKKDDGLVNFSTIYQQALSDAKISQDSAKGIDFWLSDSAKTTGAKSLRIEGGAVIFKIVDQILPTDVGHITSFGTTGTTVCVGFKINGALYQAWFKKSSNTEYVLDTSTPGTVLFRGQYYPVSFSSNKEIKLRFSLKEEK